MKHHHHSEHGGIFYHHNYTPEQHQAVHDTLRALDSDIDHAACADEDCPYLGDEAHLTRKLDPAWDGSQPYGGV